MRTLTAIGLMSGTSADGVDAALLRTDGETVVEFGPALTLPYAAATRSRLLGVRGGKGAVVEAEDEITRVHAEAVTALLVKTGCRAGDIDLIGFHGHTILHDPAAGRTWQIGDAGLLADLTGIAVVHDFRSADMASGGQGAPLAPAYHAALARGLERPLAVLNLGGVGNVTWISAEDGDLLAFDTGPGNALVDDWVQQKAGLGYDRDGAIAANGQADAALVATLMAHPYFDLAPPKSLDRDAFDPAPVAGLSLEDGAATLTAFTAAAVLRARGHLPQPPRRWLVTGGGRHNRTLMRMLGDALSSGVTPVEAAGWNGDALEAQAFAYLAVRSRHGLPLSFPGTTGVSVPQTGGRFFAAHGPLSAPSIRG